LHVRCNEAEFVEAFIRLNIQQHLSESRTIVSGCTALGTDSRHNVSQVSGETSHHMRKKPCVLTANAYTRKDPLGELDHDYNFAASDRMRYSLENVV
jgi:hypothetical protein